VLSQTISFILPAKNEEAGLALTLPRLRALYPDAEIVLVDDGSTDRTAAIGKEFGARVLSSPYSMGNGASIKRGARAATGEVLIFMDADGQHEPGDVQLLLAELDRGYDMVVGARDGDGQANRGRGMANAFYNSLSSWMTGHKIRDLTSGFRAVRAKRFCEFLHLLPNGFSYPTTITMSFFRSAYPVSYVPVNVQKRLGNSHLKPIRDGVRFLLIIFKIATLYSPVKLFAPTSGLFFALGVGTYGYSFITEHRFTNMSLLLFSAATIVFLIGLISEQITTLMYRPNE
jgi:glycosyltransferase involved in cell wall biosynthesis